MAKILNSKTTSRRIGNKSVYDATTAEHLTAGIYQPKQVDVNYVKIFLQPKGKYMIYPEEFTLATRKVFDYLCILSSKINEVIAPQHEMEERLNLSKASVDRAKEQLFEYDYIRRRAAEVYMINPGVMFKDEGDVRPSIYEQYTLLSKGKKRNNKSNATEGAE